MQPRYSFGGDEHVFVEFDDAMSLEACFRSLALCWAIRDAAIAGVTEICPANASALIRFDPDTIHPDVIMRRVQELAESPAEGDGVLETRVLEIPVYYDDPWTREVLLRFRDRHQDPESTDLEFAARENGFSSVDELIAAHSGSPWFVSMVGFISGDPFMFQMVEQSRQIQNPKYLKPRLDTPERAVVQGGSFTGIHPVRSPGGYQVYGITPVAIYDVTGSAAHLHGEMILFAPGDIVVFRPIDRPEYDEILAAVEAGSYELRERPVTFHLADYMNNPADSSARMIEALYVA